MRYDHWRCYPDPDQDLEACPCTDEGEQAPDPECAICRGAGSVNLAAYRRRMLEEGNDA